jgi:hypothetical protein
MYTVFSFCPTGVYYIAVAPSKDCLTLSLGFYFLYSISFLIAKESAFVAFCTFLLSLF